MPDIYGDATDRHALYITGKYPVHGPSNEDAATEDYELLQPDAGSTWDRQLPLSFASINADDPTYLTNLKALLDTIHASSGSYVAASSPVWGWRSTVSTANWDVSSEETPGIGVGVSYPIVQHKVTRPSVSSGNVDSMAWEWYGDSQTGSGLPAYFYQIPSNWLSDVGAPPWVYWYTGGVEVAFGFQRFKGGSYSQQFAHDAEAGDSGIRIQQSGSWVSPPYGRTWSWRWVQYFDPFNPFRGWTTTYGMEIDLYSMWKDIARFGTTLERGKQYIRVYARALVEAPWTGWDNTGTDNTILSSATYGEVRELAAGNWVSPYGADVKATNETFTVDLGGFVDARTGYVFQAGDTLDIAVDLRWMYNMCWPAGRGDGAW